MREGTKQANLSTQLFDDPDIGGIGDPEVMKILNQQLAKNPEVVVPEGYKVKQIMNVNIKYQASQRISQGHQLAFEILDQIIFKNFQTHLLIPEIQIVKVLKVKGILKKPDMSSLIPLYKRIDYYDPQKSKNFNRKSYLNKNEETAVMKTQEEIRELKPKLRPLIKLEIAKQPASYQPFYTEVAEVCEEILTAVEQGMNSLPRRPHMAPGRIENNILRIKYQKQEEEEAQKQQKEQNYRKHLKLSTKIKEKIEEESKQKHIEEEEQKKEQMRIEQEKQQKLQELKLKQMEENKQKAAEFKQKREAEKKQKEKESKKVKIIDKQKLEEIQQKTEQRQIKAEKITVQRRQVIAKQMNKQLETKGAIDYEFIERHKKQEKKILEIGIQRKEKEKEKLNLLKQVAKRSDIKKVLKQYRFQTKYMFDAMIKINTKKIEENISEALQHMQLVEWMRFNAYLNVIPGLITREDSINIFRQLTIVKEFLSGEKPYILYDEFQDGLVRIGIYAYDSLKQYYGIEQAQKGFKDTKDVIDLQPESFTGEMLEYLFQYLQLPKDRKKLEERFKMFQGNNYKTFQKGQMLAQMLFGNKNPDEDSNEQNLNNQPENDGSKTERVQTKKSISNFQDQEGFQTHREQPKPPKQKVQKKQQKNNLDKQEKENTQIKESAQDYQDQESSEDNQIQKKEKKQRKNDANSQNQRKIEANQKEESSEDEDQIQASKKPTENKQISKAANKK